LKLNINFFFEVAGQIVEALKTEKLWWALRGKGEGVKP